MSRPLSETREQEIRDLPKLIRRHAWIAAEDAAWAIRDLLVELDRLRGEAGVSDPGTDFSGTDDLNVLLAVLMHRLGDKAEISEDEIEDARCRLRDEEVQFVSFRAPFLMTGQVTVRLRSRPRNSTHANWSETKAKRLVDPGTQAVYQAAAEHYREEQS